MVKKAFQHVGGAAFDDPVCKGVSFEFGVENGASLVPGIMLERREERFDALVMVRLYI